MTSSQPPLAVAKQQTEASSLALSLRSEPSAEETSGSVRGPVLAGLVIVIGLLGGSAAWALLAPLNSAVVAPATLVVESNRRDVQHMDGGIVRSLHVRDGSEVQAGDVLITLDPTRVQAPLFILRAAIEANRVLLARLRAEEAGAQTMALEPDLVERVGTDPGLAEVVRGQRALFEARRAARNGQIEVLQQRMSQLEVQITGLEAQERARQSQIALVQDELNGVNELLRNGFAPRIRALALQRELAKLQGEQGEYLSTVARTRQQIGEAQLQILQVDRTFREEVAKIMQDTQNTLRENQERLAASEDVVRHLEIRAPISGTVVGLAVHTVGGVLPPGRVLMQIVPERDALIIEGQVQPQDIEAIQEGQEALIRFTALLQRNLPNLTGRVTLVSADRVTDERSGLPYYKVRVAPDEASLAAVSDRRLLPGMPAEVTITTGARTAARYLVDPFLDILRVSMRER
jgi:HlyD family type I secretion membrane fusion protein